MRIQTSTGIFWIIAVILLSTACDPGRLYDQSRAIPPSGWNKDSAAVFRVNIEDTTSAYNFYINLRHTTDYRYRNFYLFLDTRMPGGQAARDTIALMLADKTGKWFGQGFGNVKDLQVPVRKNLVFPAKGTYTFLIEQAMRQDELKGISNVGIRIEYADKR